MRINEDTISAFCVDLTTIQQEINMGEYPEFFEMIQYFNGVQYYEAKITTMKNFHHNHHHVDKTLRQFKFHDWEFAAVVDFEMYTDNFEKQTINIDVQEYTDNFEEIMILDHICEFPIKYLNLSKLHENVKYWKDKFVEYEDNYKSLYLDIMNKYENVYKKEELDEYKELKNSIDWNKLKRYYELKDIYGNLEEIE